MIKKDKLVAGVGINDYQDRVMIDGKNIKSYIVWKDMLHRCYDPKYQKRNPTYIGCSVCDEWINFCLFKTWFDANYVSGFALDKDILKQGNKEYGPNVCRFVPRYLNNLLTDSGKIRGQYPLGVSKKNNQYRMQCRDGNGNKIHRYHKTVEEAVADYSVTKAKVVKQQADRALAEGSIQLDAYNALINRKW